MIQETGSSFQTPNTTTISPDKLSLEELCYLKESFVDALEQKDYSELSKIAETIREAVTDKDDPLLEALVDCGVIPHLIEVIDANGLENDDLLIECSWIIANLAAGTSKQVQSLIDYGIIENALLLMNHPSDYVKDNAMWILANIAGDCVEARDMILERGVVHKMEMALLNKTLPVTVLSSVAWLITNLCRGNPSPKFSQVKEFLKIIKFFLSDVEHSEVAYQCIWALSYMSDTDSDEQISAIMELDICDKLIELLSSEDNKTVAAALRTVGNILSGNDESTSKMIEHGVIAPLYKLLMSPQSVLRKEATWAVSNILAGTTSHIKAVIKYKNGKIIKRLFELSKDQNSGISMESIFSLTNACMSKSSKHIRILIHNGIIELLVKVLKDRTENDLLKYSLNAVENILQYGSEAEINPYAQKLVKLGGFEIIKKLGIYPDAEVQELVEDILEKYCVAGLC